MFWGNMLKSRKCLEAAILVTAAQDKRDEAPLYMIPGTLTKDIIIFTLTNYYKKSSYSRLTNAVLFFFVNCNKHDHNTY